MRRLAVLLLPLALGACGSGASAGASRPATTTTTAPPSQRAPIRVLAPAPGHALAAQPFGRRLRAVVAVSGRAEPGQQLSLRGGCGGLVCEGITFADTRGHWRTRLELDSPPGHRTVGLTVSYSAVAVGEHPAALTVHLRRAAAPQAAPEVASPSSIPPASGGQVAAPSETPYSGPRTMIVIGDSLAVGMAQPLQTDLPGWDVPVDGRIGRPLREGMQILAQTSLPGGSRGRHAILAFSLFTNDSPGAVDALEGAVRDSVARLGSHGCAIWATIARPPYEGVSYAAANARLRALEQDPALAGRLLLVPWKEEYDRHPSWQTGDGVHATAAGYAGRAKMYADAAESCSA